MISEAMGKIIGMAMAYGVSALGLLLAYVNYRKRIVKAETVMTTAAWVVLAAVFVAIAVGVVVVWQLAEPVAVAGEAPVAEGPPPAVPPPPDEVPADVEERSRWPLVGILIPASIFLFATWITAGLHRHFTHHGHGAPPSGDRP